MSDDKTHNIHTWLEGWIWTPGMIDDITRHKANWPEDLPSLIETWSQQASEDSSGAFTADQCAKVMKTWPCYTGEKEK